jgi:N-acylneuraminate cytidylyltransferase/CMP-N,N'-diacetyllegionaminic acid synthase
VEILAVIPARGGSKGVPRKNVRELCGKPLIAYTIEASKKSKFITRTIVSTEDEDIKEVSLRYGAEVPYKRPLELSSDVSPTIEAVIDLLNWLKLKEDYVPDYVCLLQCTSPLRNGADIDNTIHKMIKTGFKAAVTVKEADTNPYWTNVFHGDRLQYFIEEGKYITRRQDLPAVYSINGAVYVIHTESLLREKTFEIDDLTAYVMNSENSIDIDNIIDFKIAEAIMEERKRSL